MIFAKVENETFTEKSIRRPPMEMAPANKAFAGPEKNSTACKGSAPFDSIGAKTGACGTNATGITDPTVDNYEDDVDEDENSEEDEYDD